MFVCHSLTLYNCRSVQEFTDLMYVFGIQINELFKIADIINHNKRIVAILDGIKSKL